jgi:hypothetical protein
MIFHALQAMWKIPDRVLIHNIPHKNFIRTDKISEILNDSDSDGGSFSELSNSSTCKVNSSFTSSCSSKDNEVSQSKPDRGRKRMHWALPKHANSDFELRWKEQTQTVQKPAFSRVPGINKNFHVTPDSSPWDIFEIFFSPEMFKLIQKETNQYAMQQTKKKKQSSWKTSVLSFS